MALKTQISRGPGLHSAPNVVDEDKAFTPEDD
jgi:hypothetical protein